MRSHKISLGYSRRMSFLLFLDLPTTDFGLQALQQQLLYCRTPVVWYLGQVQTEIQKRHWFGQSLREIPPAIPLDQQEAEFQTRAVQAEVTETWSRVLRRWKLDLGNSHRSIAKTCGKMAMYTLISHSVDSTHIRMVKMAALRKSQVSSLRSYSYLLRHRIDNNNFVPFLLWLIFGCWVVGPTTMRPAATGILRKPESIPD